MTAIYVGLDVGARKIHGVALRHDGYVAGHLEVEARAADMFLDWAAGASAIAIDSPDRLSTAPHGADPDPDIPMKFRKARCAEIGLLRLYRLQVPWATPPGEPVDAWMGVGMGLFDALRGAGENPIEVFPDSAFRRLAGRLGPLAKKGTRVGSEERARLLGQVGVKTAGLELWSTHGIDALVAAVVARMALTGAAIAATCGHDGSAIWIPRAPATRIPD